MYRLAGRAVALASLSCGVVVIAPAYAQDAAGRDVASGEQPADATDDIVVTGQRRAQAATRGSLQVEEDDAAHLMTKFNPLADWSEEDVWNYIRENGVPYNALHDQGYPSIGCEPCTRAIEPGEDVRAGRWWWENPESKECGLHVVDGKLIRIKSVA